jgi:hypothetical protein
MATVVTLCNAFHVRPSRHSSSNSNWRLIFNSGGVDIVNELAHPSSRFGESTVDLASRFPPEGFACVYVFGMPTGNFIGDSDLIPASLSVDTTLLNPSSIRIEMTDNNSNDLLRPRHILLWGIDAAGAIVPLAIDSDAPTLSADAREGLSSIPLTLVDSGDDATMFTEVYIYVLLTRNRYAPTKQPVSFRIEQADGTLVWSSGLEDFAKLQADGDHGARIWRLEETRPASRSDALGPLVPKLRVDGPDNAMIDSVVAFGVNRDGARPVVVPLVHHKPIDVGTNPWVGTSTSPEGREMILPMCVTASRQ